MAVETHPDSVYHYRIPGNQGLCWQCGKPTEWIEILFEAHLCPGACTEQAWEKYNQHFDAHYPAAEPLEMTEDPFNA